MGCFEKSLERGSLKIKFFEFLNLSQSARLWGALKKS
jgi:hypothetical protein